MCTNCSNNIMTSLNAENLLLNTMKTNVESSLKQSVKWLECMIVHVLDTAIVIANKDLECNVGSENNTESDISSMISKESALQAIAIILWYYHDISKYQTSTDLMLSYKIWYFDSYIDTLILWYIKISKYHDIVKNHCKKCIRKMLIYQKW